jgi:hypothetical protein
MKRSTTPIPIKRTDLGLSPGKKNNPANETT